VSHEQIAAVRKKRRGRSLFLIDLAVPRDVDPKVDEIENVFLYNVDDLSQIVAETLSSRQREAENAEEIVAAETANFERALHAEQATPTIVSLRRQLGAILEAELERSLRTRLKHLPEADREALSKMVESALNKILHPATRHLRSLAEDTEAQAELDQCVAALRDAFGLTVEGAPALSWRPGAPSLVPERAAEGTPQTPSASDPEHDDAEAKKKRRRVG
jgi:glutamyl-tRNA reductase